MSDAEEQEKVTISFYEKKKVRCLVCDTEFKRESMLTGSGRMIAGDLTDELRRTYEPSVKYGEIFPIMYAVGACPECHSAFLWNDFTTITEKKDAQFLHVVHNNSDERETAVSTLFPHYDLTRERTLLDGAAAYYLALLTYEGIDRKHSPTIKQGICALRLAWLCGDLHKKCPGYNYDYIQQAFYRKALFFYGQTQIYQEQGVENLNGILNLGPDIDKNYGYDGLVYLTCLLEFKYGQREDLSLRAQNLASQKHGIARVFGLGKSSKNKPSTLLEKGKELYNAVTKELHEAGSLDFDDDDD